MRLKRQLWLAYLGAAVVLLSVLATSLDAVLPLLQAGQLVGVDGYTWLESVVRLHEGTAWDDHWQPRSNWPDGENLHYARPFAALLLAGASLLAPVWGFDQALFWWAVVVAPVFFLALAWLVAASVAKILGPWRGPIVVLLLASQYLILDYSIPGRADHHIHLLMVFALTWSFLSQALQFPDRRSTAILGGVAAGLGLWMGLQFLVALIVCHATLVVLWIRNGDPYAQLAFRFSVAAVVILIAAIMVEMPIDEILIPRYDRVGIAHVVVLALAAGFWRTLMWAGQLGRGGSTWRDRGQLAFLCAGIVIGAVGFVFPRVIIGPLSDMDIRAQALLLNVTELTPLWPQDSAGLRGLALSLGLSFLSVPVIFYLLVRESDERRQGILAFLAVAISFFLPAALGMMRFAIYAQLIAVIIMSEFVAQFFHRLRDGSQGRLFAFAVSSAVLLMLAASFANAQLTHRKYAAQPTCNWQLKSLAEFLNARAESRQITYTILALPDLTPELLFRTPHRVISTPTRSNEAGAIALFDILSSETDVTPQRIVDERGINLFIVCEERIGISPFNERLRAGAGPAWIAKVSLPAGLEQTFDVFEKRATLPL